MTNPFKELDLRLSKIENILHELKTQPSKEKSKDKLLTVDDVAKLLKLSKQTIYQKVSRNTIPFMKQGKRLYFLEIDIIEYLKESKNLTDAELKEDAKNYLIKKGGAK